MACLVGTESPPDKSRLYPYIYPNVSLYGLDYGDFGKEPTLRRYNQKLFDTLRKIRNRALQEGMKLLSREEVWEEVDRRRGYL